MTAASPPAESLKKTSKWVGAILVLLFIVGVALPPVWHRSHLIIDHENPVLHTAHFLNMVMFAYANDNKGAYPTGNSSTEVFQKLIDEGYLSDGSILYTEGMGLKGKVKASSKKLKPENVCWDVTIPLGANSPDQIPVVFSTGYRVNYAPNGNATRLRNDVWDGIAASYHSNASKFIPATHGVITNLIDGDFQLNGKKYQQLTPDGPLP